MNTKKLTKTPPLFLHPQCREKEIRHMMKDCPETTYDQRKELLKGFREEKAKTGYSEPTRGQNTNKEEPKEY